MGKQGGIVEFVLPGDMITMTAGAAIVGGNLVKMSADRTVIPTAAVADAKVIGLAIYTAANGDKDLTIATDGVWPLVADGAIGAGDDLTSGAVAGTVKTLAAAATAVAADINNARNVIAMALEAISNTNSGRVKVMR